MRSIPHATALAALQRAARDCLEERDIEAKVTRSRDIAEAWRAGTLPAPPAGALPAAHACEHPSQPIAGLPVRLVLTHAADVPRRSMGSPRGMAAFVHAIAHIEWNAINLAWDAVWRFGGMPLDYYSDWTGVAAEEALHFSMLRERLRELGHEYGDFEAHAGLWSMAEATAGDVLSRMALVPRVLEARGLDVTPALIARLRRFGDEKTAAVLEVILRDEVGHVRIGSRWFHYLCEQRGLDPVTAFAEALRTHFRGSVKAPMSRDLRRRAGFTDAELSLLDALSAKRPTA